MRRFCFIAAIVLVAGGWSLSLLRDEIPAGAPTPRFSQMDALVPSARAASTAKQIVFGDLHVHTIYSADAFLGNLPHAGGEGAFPPSDACDYARFCSRIDFMAITDHAESISPAAWKDTIESIRSCNRQSTQNAHPELVSFLGWEWTQQGETRADHYGHKNIILRDLEEGRIPARPIAAGGRVKRVIDASLPKSEQIARMSALSGGAQIYRELGTFIEDLRGAPECAANVSVRDLAPDCHEYASTPAELFAKLDEWDLPALVIPHGLAWGVHASAGSDWKTQLTKDFQDPRQRLVEVYSGHGNSEEYRSFRSVQFDAQGNPYCPAPDQNYEASCWRAGTLVQTRCLKAGGAPQDCVARARATRKAYAETLVAPAELNSASLQDWGLAGQCTDCFLPAYKYEPQMSAQYLLAASNHAERQDGRPLRARFGLIGSSDNHSARAGNGYKEYGRRFNTESRQPPQGPVARAFNLGLSTEYERLNSFQFTGGLVAVHAQGRTRQAIFDGLNRREAYATSGPRILLWFDLTQDKARLPMGSEALLSDTPIFDVRAVGSFKQKPGCPADAAESLGSERLARLCRGECYHPGDERKFISRIEIIRITPQAGSDEAMDKLIEDPWRVFICPKDRSGCRITFRDDDFAARKRDAVYYVRAIEEPSPGVNGASMRCLDRAKDGTCKRVSHCDARTPEDDCLDTTEERAWSSPIFVDYRKR